MIKQIFLLSLLVYCASAYGARWFWDDVGQFELDEKEGAYTIPNLKDPKNWPNQLKSCRINGYKLTKFIAAGCQGRIFQAQKGDHKIAIKFFKNSLEAAKEISMFDAFDKLNPKSKILTEQIPNMDNQCCEGDIACLALEWIEGKTLTKIMLENGLSLSNPEVVFNPRSLKPMNVQTVKTWTYQSLIGHSDMERAGVANPDQNLRNIMWDEQNQKLKFLDMGLACKKDNWDPHTYRGTKYILYQQLVRGIIPQDWKYLGLFLKEKDRNQYWSFLDSISNFSVQNAKQALQIATKQNGYLSEFGTDGIPRDPTNCPGRGPTYPTNDPDHEEHYPNPEYIANKGLSGGAIAGIIIGTLVVLLFIIFLIYYFCFKNNTKPQTINNQFSTANNSNRNDMFV